MGRRKSSKVRMEEERKPDEARNRAATGIVLVARVPGTEFFVPPFGVLSFREPPKVGDRIEVDGLRYAVVHADGLLIRVEK